MKCYQTPWGWFFQFSFQEPNVGFGVRRIETIPFAHILRVIHTGDYTPVSYEELPNMVKIIITASASCMVETAYSDIKELSKKEQK